jgi:hypothetical protein
MTVFCYLKQQTNSKLNYLFELTFDVDFREIILNPMKMNKLRYL